MILLSEINKPVKDKQVDDLMERKSRTVVCRGLIRTVTSTVKK